MRPTELHIFDFDGTIFNSPTPPASYGKRGWWDDPRSLEPPCVPERPGGSWYNNNVVSAFRKADANPKAVTVVMTGRLHYFRPRVKELLASGGIKPDELFLKQPGGGATEAYKVAAMRYLLKQMPQTKVIEFWEDRLNHLKNFELAAARLGYTLIPRPVKAKDRPAACDIEPLSGRVAARWMDDQLIQRVATAGRPRIHDPIRYKITSMKKGQDGVELEGTFEFDERKSKGPFAVLWKEGRIQNAMFNRKRAQRLGSLLQREMGKDHDLMRKIKKLSKG